MKLTQEGLKDTKVWSDAGINLPAFDYKKVKEETLKNPRWLHFGAGNIFRAFPCAVQQTLLNKGIVDYGIIVAEGYDYEIIDQVYRPHDNIGLLVTLKSDGTTEKTVISSVVESLALDRYNEHDFNRLIKIIEQESLQMLSFTITEKGYNVVGRDGNLMNDIQIDVENDIREAQSYMGKLVSLLYKRFKKGAYPLALVSMDNCSHNGKLLHNAVLTLAQAWLKQGSIDQSFIDYINNDQKLSFPWTMIDKITPRPDDLVKQQLIDLGFEDAQPRITEKGTYVASFVNAEEAEYLVIEDKFPNGRPPLDEAGIIFTSQETVNKIEKMKVCTCLNPLHTALAIFGCLLGFEKISDEMQDDDLRKMVEIIGYKEGLPVVVDPGIVDPKAFIDEVLNVRFPNPFMPDTPQRIATDTSQKLSIRFLETIKSYDVNTSLDVNSLVLIPLVIAGWIRYLMGINDSGEVFELSSDPLLESLIPLVEDIQLGSNIDYSDRVKSILENKNIFTINLYDVGLGEKVESFFNDLISGPGAVRKTLNRCVNK